MTSTPRRTAPGSGVLDLRDGRLTCPQRLLDRVGRFASELSRAGRPREVCDAMVCAALDAIAAEGALVYLCNSGAPALRLAAATGEVTSSPTTVLLDGDGAQVDAYRECSPRWPGDDGADPNRAHVPLVAADLCHGVLTLEFACAPELASAEREFLGALASLGAVGLDRARALEAERNEGRGQRELLGVVAHELRHPLSVILMKACSLRRREPGEPLDLERDMEVLERNANRLNRMIQDALDYAQIAQRRFRVEPAVEDAGALLRAAVDDAPEPHRVRLLGPPPSAFIDVWCDAGRTRQVVDNLVRNALKFSDASERVTVRLEPRASEVIVQVRDRGVGIPRDELRRLFDPPKLGDARRCRTKRRGEGAGLGLFITRGLVEAQGGRIEVDSREGEGSCFTFTIPRASAAAAFAREGVVLVVDDDPSLQRELIEQIERAGYRAVGATHGGEALDYLRAHPPPALVLLDLRMPVMSGWELRELMGGDDQLSAVPVVVLSSSEPTPDEAPLPVAGRLTKPVTVSGLLSVIGRHVRGPSG